MGVGKRLPKERLGNGPPFSVYHEMQGGPVAWPEPWGNPLTAFHADDEGGCDSRKLRLLPPLELGALKLALGASTTLAGKSSLGRREGHRSSDVIPRKCENKMVLEWHETTIRHHGATLWGGQKGS